MFDYRATYFLFIFLVHMRSYTFYMFLGVMAILWLIEKKWDYNVPAVARRFKIFLTGPVKNAMSEKRRTRSDR